MNLLVTKITRTDDSPSADYVLVTLTDMGELSDDPQHLYNHVEFRVFVRHPDVWQLSFAEIKELALPEVAKVIARITAG